MTDYISREAARPDAFCTGISCQECPFCKDNLNGGCRVDDFIMALPAADVAPVVHAEWIMTKYVSEDTMWWSWHCSNCGDTYDGLGKLDERKHKYCHHCGAKMDVEWEAHG